VTGDGFYGILTESPSTPLAAGPITLGCTWGVPQYPVYVVVQPNGLLLMMQCCFLVYACGLEGKAVEGITTARATRVCPAEKHIQLTWQNPAE